MHTFDKVLNVDMNAEINKTMHFSALYWMQQGVDVKRIKSLTLISKAING
jgi:hypothetical protein